MPSLSDIKEGLPTLIEACGFGETPITVQAPRISKAALEKAKAKMKDKGEDNSADTAQEGEEE